MHTDISDNGGDISADIAPKIVDPYFTDKDESGSTGVGFYMPRMIAVNSFYGRLRILESKRCAVFQIERPLEVQE